MNNDETRSLNQDMTQTEASPESRQPVMPPVPPSRPSNPDPAARSLLDAARARGLVRAKRRGNFNRNPNGNGGFRDHPENRAKGGHKKSPTSQRELKALLAELANESVAGADGEEVQRLVLMLRKMMDSKSPVDHMEILNRLVGRQASKVDMTSGGQRLGWGAFIAMTVAPSLPAADAGAVVDGDVTDADEGAHALPDGSADADAAPNEEEER